jgi:hypothetical protein
MRKWRIEKGSNLKEWPGGGSTVVEHSTTYPEIQGLNPATLRHQEENGRKKIC